MRATFALSGVAMAMLGLAACGEAVPQATVDPLSTLTFSDAQPKTLASYPGKTVAVWGMCRS
jgi:hypothetical protein